MKLNRPSNNDFRGTKFQKKVWNYLKTIRKGSVKTYKQVAIAINIARTEAEAPIATEPT